mmetsp:Transcript_45889/g.127719  ORF Transcript_45889/g.127719 Transcript_45889/m.127719 type:complete len:242 (-) Transcript_45889:129-854(-)
MQPLLSPFHEGPPCWHPAATASPSQTPAGSQQRQQPPSKPRAGPGRRRGPRRPGRPRPARAGHANRCLLGGPRLPQRRGSAGVLQPPPPRSLAEAPTRRGCRCGTANARAAAPTIGSLPEAELEARRPRTPPPPGPGGNLQNPREPVQFPLRWAQQDPRWSHRQHPSSYRQPPPSGHRQPEPGPPPARRVQLIRARPAPPKARRADAGAAAAQAHPAPTAAASPVASARRDRGHSWRPQWC